MSTAPGRGQLRRRVVLGLENRGSTMSDLRYFPWCVALAALALAAAPASAQRPAPLQPGLLRVCADPDNLPSSSDKGEGYEQKIADLIAKEWDTKRGYVWCATRRGWFGSRNGMYC